MDFESLSAAQIKSGIENREWTAVECLQESLKRAKKASELNAYVRFNEEGAERQAKAVDLLVEKGETLPPLAGVPFALKDLFVTRGLETNCGSKILKGFRPTYNATVTEKLHLAGAVMIGKTNMDEFAMGSSNENSAHGPVKNPHDPTRVPGGSSGGSAAAVAQKSVPVAIGTDTGGSIRQPSSLCGVVGLKPTYGRVSRYGMIAYASSLDQAGPITRSVEDAALFLQSMWGKDHRDSTSVERKFDPLVEAAKNGKNLESLKDLRIGIPKEFFTEGLESSVEKSVKESLNEAERAGAKLKEISLPHSSYAVSVYYVVAVSEASSNLARFDGVRFGYRNADAKTLEEMYKKSRGEGFGPEVKRRILLGTFALSEGYYDAYYAQACRVRRLIQKDFFEAFKEVDLIAGPVSPEVAFPLGEKTEDPVKMYLNDIYTIPVNLAGLPAISIPCAKDKKSLPIGLQLIGNTFEEKNLIENASAFETILSERSS